MRRDELTILCLIAQLADDQAMHGVADRMPCLIGCGAAGVLRQRLIINPGGKRVTVALCGPHAHLIATKPDGWLRPDTSPRPVDLVLPAGVKRTEAP